MALGWRTGGERRDLRPLPAIDHGRTPGARGVVQDGKSVFLVAITPRRDRDRGHIKGGRNRLQGLAPIEFQQGRGPLKRLGFERPFRQQVIQRRAVGVRECEVRFFHASSLRHRPSERK